MILDFDNGMRREMKQIFLKNVSHRNEFIGTELPTKTFQSCLQTMESFELDRVIRLPRIKATFEVDQKGVLKKTKLFTLFFILPFFVLFIVSQ